MRRAPLAFLSLVLLQLSCGEPDLPTNRAPAEAGVSFDDDADVPQDDGGTSAGPCPESIPTRGSSCGPGVDDQTSCEFTTGTCMANGTTFNETARYCCPNGYWEPCGGESPCDNYVDAAEPPPPEDAGPPAPHLDASSDALDGGIDTTVD